MTPRQINIASACIVALMFAMCCAGCGLSKLINEGVDASVKIRPGGKNPDMQPPPVPPAPKPPPDDWAPPWFRRPKPEKHTAVIEQLHFVSLTDDQSREQAGDEVVPLPDELATEPMGGLIRCRCAKCGDCLSEVQHHPEHHKPSHPAWNVAHGLWQWFMLPVTIVDGLWFVAALGIVAVCGTVVAVALLRFLKK